MCRTRCEYAQRVVGIFTLPSSRCEHFCQWRKLKYLQEVFKVCFVSCCHILAGRLSSAWIGSQEPSHYITMKPKMRTSSQIERQVQQNCPVQIFGQNGTDFEAEVFYFYLFQNLCTGISASSEVVLPTRGELWFYSNGTNNHSVPL